MCFAVIILPGVECPLETTDQNPSCYHDCSLRTFHQKAFFLPLPTFLPRPDERPWTLRSPAGLPGHQR